MTQDEIIEMARQAEFCISPIDSVLLPKLEAFYKLVAAKAEAKERESCAKVCEDINSNEDYYGERTELACAESIRARGQE